MCCSSFGLIDGEAVVEIGWKSPPGGSKYLPLIQLCPSHISQENESNMIETAYKFLLRGIAVWSM
jgi:hypothetical protein